MYTLRFPFQFAPGQEITDFPETVERRIGGLSLKFERKAPFHVLKVEGFEAEEAARDYVNRLWAGLMWVLLNRDIAFDAVIEFGKVTYAEDPKKAAENLGIEGAVDGAASEGQPTVYPSDKRILMFRALPASFVVGTPFDAFYSLLAEGLSATNSSGVIGDSRLRTALELYVAYTYEYSPRARFLTLVMVLEVLAEPRPKPAYVLDLLNRWREEANQLKRGLLPDSEERKGLEALERELRFRRDSSVRSRIRSLVHDTLRAEDNPKAEELARLAVAVYDKRSSPVHDGTLPPRELSEAETDAKQIVGLALKAKFALAAGIRAQSG